MSGQAVCAPDEWYPGTMRFPRSPYLLGLLFLACGKDGAAPGTAVTPGVDSGGGSPDGAAAVVDAGPGGSVDGGSDGAAAADASSDAGAADAGPPAPISFAIIGDFGNDSPREAAVAALVKSWSPDFIVTTGDNNYGAANGGVASYDTNVGKHYGDYISPYAGQFWDASAPAAKNRFWPVLGNRDWDIGPGLAYADFFTLPGNERYYDLTIGPVHFTMLDSDAREPDGIVAGGVQATWAEATIKGSSAPFQFVFHHHPAYVSGTAEARMRWSFKTWGADAYFTGHIHLYERLVVDGQQYFINGQGGTSTSNFGTTAPGSAVRYNAMDGAMRVTVTSTKATFRYFTVAGTMIDEVAIDPTGAVVP